MSLRRRLAKLEGEIGAAPLRPTYDLRLLHPEEVDFICQFTFRRSDDQAYLDNLPTIEALLRSCEIEATYGCPVFLPEFPRDLQMYWRHQRHVNGESELPRGNYDFKNLSFAAHARFQLLCDQYGWDPEADEVEIDPLSLWCEDDLSELCGLLECAIPASEKEAKRRRHMPGRRSGVSRLHI